MVFLSVNPAEVVQVEEGQEGQEEKADDIVTDEVDVVAPADNEDRNDYNSNEIVSPNGIGDPGHNNNQVLAAGNENMTVTGEENLTAWHIMRSDICDKSIVNRDYLLKQCIK